jgi:hypothetical protein
MDHLPEHLRQQARNGGCCFPGNPGRPSLATKRAWIEAKARELADGKFDALSARDRALLLEAAALMLQPKRKGEDPVRRANSIGKLLHRVRGVAEPPPPSFEETLLP